MAAKKRKKRPRPAPTVQEVEEKDGVTQLAVRISSRLYRKVKVRSIETGDSMSQLTEDAYRALLEKSA